MIALKKVTPESEPLSKYLPYWSFLKKGWISKDGRIHRSIKVSGVDSNVLDDDQLEILSGHLNKIFQVLDEGVGIHVICDVGTDIKIQVFLKSI